MPPKRKKAGISEATSRKKGSGAEASSPEFDEEVEKKRLLEEIRSLKSKCEAEEKLRKDLEAEKEQIQNLRTLEQNAAETKKDLLRKKEKEFQDELEGHSMQRRLCKLRIKQLLAEQTEEAARLKINAEAALKLREDIHREKEQHNKSVERSKLAANTEAHIAHEQLILQLGLLQDERVLELRNEFQRSARDLHQKWKLRLENLREDMQKRRTQVIANLEESKNNHVLMVQSQNTKRAQAIKRYYGDIATSNLELIKCLKSEHAALKLEEVREEKRLAELTAKNKGLVEPLKQTTQETDNFQEELQLYEGEKMRLAEAKQKLIEQTATLQRIEHQAEILKQQTAILQKNKNELQHRYQTAVYDLQQKASLKALILEKKIEALQDAEAVAIAQIEELKIQERPETEHLSGLSQKVDALIHAQDAVTAEIKKEIQTIKQMHASALEQFAGCMAADGAAIEDLEFVPKTLS